ncbi:MAG: isochorismatase family protein [Chitinivibrionales bacterium]|nr:isochorismatase family protein [Chitinivibrionales bacterium]
MSQAFVLPPGAALIVVDMQNYYLDPQSAFQRYHEHRFPGSMSYIARRCSATVIPNLRVLLDFFHRLRMAVVFLKLCGQHPGRSDLHRTFRTAHYAAMDAGFPDLYPLCGDPMANVISDIAIHPDDITLCKTTFSAFTGTTIDEILHHSGISTLVMCGLATSQCVETTARDGSERGYRIIMVEDAQADYEEMTHGASLYSSQGVCGGTIVTTNDVIDCQELPVD